MPLDKETEDRLLETLAENGWSYRSDFIYAPNETIWLPVTQPWHDDLENLLETMLTRMEKIRRHKEHHTPDEQNKILQAIGSLISVIQQLVNEKKTNPKLSGEPTSKR